MDIVSDGAVVFRVAIKIQRKTKIRFKLTLEHWSVAQDRVASHFS